MSWVESMLYACGDAPCEGYGSTSMPFGNASDYWPIWPACSLTPAEFAALSADPDAMKVYNEAMSVAGAPCDRLARCAGRRAYAPQRRARHALRPVYGRRLPAHGRVVRRAASDGRAGRVLASRQRAHAAHRRQAPRPALRNLQVSRCELLQEVRPSASAARVCALHIWQLLAMTLKLHGVV